jgi:hypothetical protein
MPNFSYESISHTDEELEARDRKENDRFQQTILFAIHRALPMLAVAAAIAAGALLLHFRQ